MAATRAEHLEDPAVRIDLALRCCHDRLRDLTAVMFRAVFALGPCRGEQTRVLREVPRRDLRPFALDALAAWRRQCDGEPVSDDALESTATAAGVTAETRVALAELCELYWPPVYTFVRRSGLGPHDALDVTQDFFAHILEHNDDLARVDQQRGRFRAWLLGTLKHFLANEWRRARAQKRGGGSIVLSIDAMAAEDRYAHEPADLLTPEHIYERRWALTVLGHAMNQLEREHAAPNKRSRFERLKGFLIGDEPSYDALARELGEPAGTLRVQVHRLRRRYRDLLRAEIAETVETPADIDDELRNLFSAL